MVNAISVRPFVCLVTLLALSAPALAQPTPQDDTVKEVARQRYAAGVKAFDAGQYEEARVAFLEAYRLTNAPGTLLNLGITELKTNRVAEGGNHLLRFLRDYAEATPEQKASAQQALEDCKKRAALLTINVDMTGAEVTVDGASIGRSPLADPVFVEPGEHVVTGADRGNKASAKVDLKRGQSLLVTLKVRTVVGGAGESCEARSDCEEGLRCIERVCLAAGQEPPTQAKEKERKKEPEPPPRGFDGLRGHLGLILGGGPTHTDNTALGTAGSLVFSLKGGVFIDRAELGLEFSPASFVLTFGPDVPLVQMNAYVGYHIPLAGPVSWPMRFGVGFSHFAPAGGRTEDVTLEGRADLVGASVLLDPILLDFFVPSFRVNSNLDNAHFFTYVFGVGASWLPD